MTEMLAGDVAGLLDLDPAADGIRPPTVVYLGTGRNRVAAIVNPNLFAGHNAGAFVDLSRRADRLSAHRLRGL